MPRNRNRVAAAVAVAALAGGGAGAGIVALTQDGGHTATTVTAPLGATTSNVADASLTVGQVAKLATASVVEIDATSSVNQSPFPDGGQGSQSAEGTGFVYDTKGNIVTNEHVIDGASSVSVKFSDGSTYKASIVGTDIMSDLAVIHVNAPASKLVPLTLGDSSKVAVGDGVVAIGNPFGLDGTVTSGIVSAINREISAPDAAQTPIEGAIQTDAAINHGNSGGPLLNLKAQVIGVTSQIQSDSGGSDGVGFAIPSNTVRTIADQLVATGKAQHALLGVIVKTGTNGVVVSSVQTGSAADDAGLKAGDVIVSAGGTKVTTAEQLRAIIAQHKPGDTLSLTVLRNGSSKTLSATLGSKS